MAAAEVVGDRIGSAPVVVIPVVLLRSSSSSSRRQDTLELLRAAGAAAGYGVASRRATAMRDDGSPE